MSRYDTEYIKHYLNIVPIQLDVACFHLPEDIKYTPVRNEILISPVNVNKVLPFESISHMNNLAKYLGYNLIFSDIKTIYKNYNYYDLVKHKANVLFPYSVFSISMIELYELNIPTFVPSDNLLLESGIMNDVSLFPLYCDESYMKVLDKPNNISPHKFSPNSYNINDKKYWLQYSYFKQKNNIIYWDSPEDLFTKLTTLNFNTISNNMKIENDLHKEQQLVKWRNLIELLNNKSSII
jgi:hypothetical protein